MKRITALISVDAGVRKEVAPALEETGATRKSGRAPRTFMERELQSWLDAYLANESK